MTDLPHIDDARVTAVFSAADAVRSCADAFRLYGRGDMSNPPRSEHVEREGDEEVFRLELPGAWGDRWRGRKVIIERSSAAGGRLGERQARIELQDLASGTACTLDAEVITNMRTGAAGALGLSYLTSAPLRRIAIVGTGRIARAVARCVDVVCEPERITVTSRARERRDAFREDVGPAVEARVEASASLEACLRDADAVISTVPTPVPLLHIDSLRESVPLSVIAGDPRTVQVHVDLLCRRPVLVDHHEQALRSGDFVAAGDAGRLEEISLLRRPEGAVADIGDAALGRLRWPDGPAGIAYFTGMAVQDLHAAVTVWERLRDGSAA